MSRSLKIDLSGKVALVTGAGSGFGQAISCALAQAGATVFGVGRREKSLGNTARLAGRQFRPLGWDVRQIARASELVDNVTSQAGALHILINNAAVLRDEGKKLSEISNEDWDLTWQTNVSGGFALTRAAISAMRRQKYGRVVFVSSGLGFRPMAGYGAYCISKAAVNMMTRVFADESVAENILVNAIDPGVAKTEMNPSAGESPDSIREVALFLASLPAGGASGQCFNKRLQLVSW